MTGFRPQPGPQEAFLATPADMAIYGGAAGGGKTWGLLLEATRHVHIPLYRCVGFRKTGTRLRVQGGLWDESTRIYPHLGGQPREHVSEWRFPSGAQIKLSHLEDVHAWDGGQIDFEFFDELTEFPEYDWWYMMSRNRSRCGIAPYMRGTCNPDATSWVRTLIDWWIGSDGLPIRQRCGRLRWFVREDGVIRWVKSDYVGPDGNRPRSLTFISALVTDNPALMTSNPDYVHQLYALPSVERDRLLKGNWNVRYTGGMFKRAWFEILDVPPAGVRWVRYWDQASTPNAGEKRAWTSGVKIGITRSGVVVIADVRRVQEGPAGVESLTRTTAQQDGREVPLWLEQEPGSAGVNNVSHYARFVVPGFDIHGDRPTGDKVTRARPLAAQAEVGNVVLVRGPWNEAFLHEAENYPSGTKDQVDAAAGGYNVIVSPEFRQATGGLLVGRA